MKPENKNIEERAEKIRLYLKENKRFCTKEELSVYLGCNERIVRDCINYLRNKGCMIVSVSSKKGYRRLSRNDISEEDAELVKQMWCEIDNRIKELESMKRVCKKYWDYREEQIFKQNKEKANDRQRDDEQSERD